MGKGSIKVKRSKGGVFSRSESIVIVVPVRQFIADAAPRNDKATGRGVYKPDKEDNRKTRGGTATSKVHRR